MKIDEKGLLNTSDEKGWEKMAWPVVLLIPAWTDTSYFHEYILGKADIRFLRGRVRFLREDGSRGDAAPFPSMIVVYNA